MKLLLLALLCGLAIARDPIRCSGEACGCVNGRCWKDVNNIRDWCYLVDSTAKRNPITCSSNHDCSPHYDCECIRYYHDTFERRPDFTCD